MKAKIIDYDEGKSYPDNNVIVPNTSHIAYDFNKYVTFFEDKLKKDDVIHLCVSKKIWPRYYDEAINAFYRLSNEKNKVIVLDTGLGGAGGMLLADYAIELQNQYNVFKISMILNDISRRCISSELIDDNFFDYTKTVLSPSIRDNLNIKNRYDYVGKNLKAYPLSCGNEYIRLGSYFSDLSYVKFFVNKKNIDRFEKNKIAIVTNYSPLIIANYIQSLDYFDKIIIDENPSAIYSDRVRNRYLSIAVLEKDVAKVLEKKKNK